MWVAMCCISIHWELEGTTEGFAWVALYPSDMSGYEGFLFGFDVLPRHLIHICEITGSCVSQLLSYCITFLSEHDQHQRSSGIHKLGKASSKASPYLLLRQKTAARSLARESSVRLLSVKREEQYNAFSLPSSPRTNHMREKATPHSAKCPVLEDFILITSCPHPTIPNHPTHLESVSLAGHPSALW